MAGVKTAVLYWSDIPSRHFFFIDYIWRDIPT